MAPHRFEDLVRQLAYDFRNWRSLEAIGRSGTDEGVDIRGIEQGDATDEHLDTGGDDIAEPDAPVEHGANREWIFQCKREKTLGPKKVNDIIKDFFSGTTETPYGYVLAAACDFSKAARDAFADAL